jgi:Mg2+/Co2+ transporter CorB
LNDLPISLLIGCIFLLIIISGFFSSSETGMLSLNRYRLKHLSKTKHKAAIRAQKLLSQPERLIGVILIGNNLVNILASSIATVIAMRLFGDAGIAIATLVLTLVILIFAEVTPKTIAALYPEKVAFPASLILMFLLKLLYPFVWLTNHITGFILRICGINPQAEQVDQLSSDELRTIVDEAGELIPTRHQDMLLNILDLEDATVEDIMIPRGEMFAINLNDGANAILQQIDKCEYTRIPVYEDDIDNILGILHTRNLAKFLSHSDFSVEALRKLIREPVFTPEGTGLHMQLVNFQKEKRRIAVVVDEYGAVMGLVTLEDILEEIVGEFTSNLVDDFDNFFDNDDGTFTVPGSASIREVNRFTHFKLPVSGPKTLNGLVLEHLESFPDANITVAIGKYLIEIVEIKDHVIETARLSLRKKQ